MTTKIIQIDLPFDNKELEKTLDEYTNDGYVVLSAVEINNKLVIILQKYSATIFSGPYTFNITGDV